jgi:hypothetical protein
VNKNLRKSKFKMETLQREGRSLFEHSHCCRTADVSSAKYTALHHNEMTDSAHPFLDFEWQGIFYCFEVLPFGLSLAPWLFTTVMSHSVRFIRYTGGDVIAFLDDCIFGGCSAHWTVTLAQRMLGVLREFGWLIHPTKCVGTSSALQTFVALGGHSVTGVAIRILVRTRKMDRVIASRPPPAGESCRESR